MRTVPRMPSIHIDVSAGYRASFRRESGFLERVLPRTILLTGTIATMIVAMLLIGAPLVVMLLDGATVAPIVSMAVTSSSDNAPGQRQ